MRVVSVVYEDDDFIVINKESGLAVQGGERVSASVDDILAERFGRRQFLVHRLDKDTSGLLLVAKTKEVAAKYSALFAGKGISKTYLAVCAGCPVSVSGIIADPVHTRGREQTALTRYRVRAAGDSFSLLELELGTGRMHQLRVHLAGLGNPILGDDKYGDFPLNKRFRKERGLKRLLLHAYRLSVNGATPALVFTAPLPAQFTPYLEELAVANVF
ncbi:MAG: RluA family pseudouridine synthase [Treponemataceae bacterium]